MALCHEAPCLCLSLAYEAKSEKKNIERDSAHSSGCVGRSSVVWIARKVDLVSRSKVEHGAEGPKRFPEVLMLIRHSPGASPRHARCHLRQIGFDGDPELDFERERWLQHERANPRLAAQRLHRLLRANPNAVARLGRRKTPCGVAAQGSLHDDGVDRMAQQLAR